MCEEGVLGAFSFRGSFRCGCLVSRGPLLTSEGINMFCSNRGSIRFKTDLLPICKTAGGKELHPSA